MPLMSCKLWTLAAKCFLDVLNYLPLAFEFAQVYYKIYFHIHAFCPNKFHFDDSACWKKWTKGKIL
jgi:hypothetical protein